MILPFDAISQILDFEKEKKASDRTPANCSMCEDLADNEPGRGVWKDRSISELEEGAKAGCQYCLLISKGIRACVPENELTDQSALDARLARVLPRGNMDKPPNRYGIGMFHLVGDERWEGKSVPVAAIPCGDTESDAALERARAWLEECVKNHEKCGGGDEQPAPKRLIDVSVDQTQDVRLVELDGTPCRFACLSHCWGSTTSIKTTKETLEQRKDRIEWSSLCATFRDAVTVVRRLGLRYVWIDSLCIVQDDHEDWEKEAAKMATIYESGHLTIAATRSHNHDGGCFSKLKPQHETHEVSVSAPGQDKLTLYFRQMLPHCKDIVHSPQQAIEFPLLDRGWVYQERLLSRRVLHFNNNEISWECAHTSTCECGDIDESVGLFIRPPYRHPAIGGLMEPKIHHGRLDADKELSLKIDRWHELVQEYSGLKISFAKDALPALAGLAKQMQRLRGGDSYAAGLWNSSLDFDLLWSAEDDTARRPDEWRGPTWSWVSTTSAVNYLRAHFRAITEVYFEVEDGNVRVSGLDPLGQVMPPTYIKVNCLLFDGTLRYATLTEKNDDSDGGKEAAANLIDRSRYEIHIDGSAVGVFDADYDLRTARGGYEPVIPDGFQVELALMAKTDNNYIYVVIVRVLECAMVGAVRPIGTEEYLATSLRICERIGLLVVGHNRDTIPPFHESMEPREEVIPWR
ncbi:HET-domain-containing protein [Thozetella sp. PMI_491]|nr:HET-domain-containing protein [Thozetella sp. PMI_491]